MQTRIIPGKDSRFIEYISKNPISVEKCGEINRDYFLNNDEVAYLLRGVSKRKLSQRMSSFFNNFLILVDGEGITIEPDGHKDIPGSFERVLLGQDVLIKPRECSRIIGITHKYPEYAGNELVRSSQTGLEFKIKRESPIFIEPKYTKYTIHNSI